MQHTLVVHFLTVITKLHRKIEDHLPLYNSYLLQQARCKCITRGNKDFFNCYTFIEYHLHGNHLYHFNVICKTSIAELEWWPSKGFRSVHATIWREMPAKVKKAPLWFFSCYKQRLGIIAQCFTELGLDMLVMWTVFIALYFCVVAMFWYGLHSGKLQYILIVLNVLFSIQAIWHIYCVKAIQELFVKIK